MTTTTCSPRRDAVPRLALMAVELPDAALDQTLSNARVKPIGKFRETCGACRNHELARDTLRMTPFERGHQPAHVGSCALPPPRRAPGPALPNRSSSLRIHAIASSSSGITAPTGYQDHRMHGFI